MMRYIYYIAIAIFLGLIGFNARSLDFNHWNTKENWIYSLCILSGICGLLLCLIMLLIENFKRKKASITPPTEQSIVTEEI